MIKISDIYVSTPVYLLQQISLYQGRNNSQHYMLARPDFKNISIDTYRREMFPTFMLIAGVYITCSVN